MSFLLYARWMMKLKSQGRLLEIGCSYGHLLKRLESRFDTYGIDVSKHAIGICKKICKKSTTFLADAQDLGMFPSEFFDVVVALHVIEHLDKPLRALAEIWRILREQGLLLFVVPNMTPRPTLKYLPALKDETHTRPLPRPHEWYRMLKEAGFATVIMFSDGFLEFPFAPFLPIGMQRAIFGFLTGMQLLTGKFFVSLNCGANVIVVARKTRIQRIS